MIKIKNLKIITLFTLLVFICGGGIFAQCTEFDSEVKISVKNASDYNFSLELLYSTNKIILFKTNKNIDTVLCFPKNTCLEVLYNLKSENQNSEYPELNIYLDKKNILHKRISNQKQSKNIFNCKGGGNCFNPIYLSDFNYLDGIVIDCESPDTWYSFSPKKKGYFEISTNYFNENKCDTRLYVYDRCTNMKYLETQEYSYAYNDNVYNSKQSLVKVALDSGVEYYIRVGDSAEDCQGKIIKWRLKYADKIKGCMDTNSCNYNPLAEIADNVNCIPFSKNCSHDLAVFKKDIYKTIEVTQYKSKGYEDECELYEGCFKAIGIDRQLLNFSSLIENVGNIDFYIGNPTQRPEYFIFDPCHNHYHYNELVSVNLYDSKLDLTSTGFKAGFCLIDANCEPTIQGKYNSCINQGISPKCWDYYGPAATCNWLDISDLKEGDYYFTISVNKKNKPDALNRFEKDLLNNLAIIKINLSKNDIGKYQVKIIDTTIENNRGIGKEIFNKEFNQKLNSKEYVDIKIDEFEKNVLEAIKNEKQYNSIYDLTNDGNINIIDLIKFKACEQSNSGILLADKNPFINSSIFRKVELPKNYLDSININVQQFDTISNVAILFINSTACINSLQFDFQNNFIKKCTILDTTYSCTLLDISNQNKQSVLVYNFNNIPQNFLIMKVEFERSKCYNQNELEKFINESKKIGVTKFFNQIMNISGSKKSFIKIKTIKK